MVTAKTKHTYTVIKQFIIFADWRQLHKYYMAKETCKGVQADQVE